MTNYNEVAKALLVAAEEFKGAKRNAAGKVNGNASGAIKKRLVAKLEAAGETYKDAYGMAHDLGAKYGA